MVKSGDSRSKHERERSRQRVRERSGARLRGRCCGSRTALPWLVRRSDCLSSSSARRRSTRSASSSPLSDRAAPLSACAREISVTHRLAECESSLATPRTRPPIPHAQQALRAGACGQHAPAPERARVAVPAKRSAARRRPPARALPSRRCSGKEDGETPFRRPFGSRWRRRPVHGAVPGPAPTAAASEWRRPRCRACTEGKAGSGLHAPSARGGAVGTENLDQHGAANQARVTAGQRLGCDEQLDMLPWDQRGDPSLRHHVQCTTPLLTGLLATRWAFVRRRGLACARPRSAAQRSAAGGNGSAQDQP